MSDISSPTSPPPYSKKPPKRPRNDDLQRERKRELDRRAQRNSREKQRQYIARLEKTIEILQKNSGNAATTELLEEIRRLEAETERLTAIIERIKSALTLSTCEGATRPPCVLFGDFSFVAVLKILKKWWNEMLMMIFCRPKIPSPKENEEEAKPNNDEEAEIEIVRDTWPAGSVQNVQNVQNVQPWPEFPADLTFTSQSYIPHSSTALTNLNHNYGRTPDMIGPVMAGTTPQRPRVDLNRAWAFISPLATHMSTPKAPDEDFGKLWQRVNDIYGQIFKIPPAQAAPAALLPSNYYGGAICKAVITGWDSLSAQERHNPILRILKDMEAIFSTIDPVSKIAFMYKSHSLLKVSYQKSNGLTLLSNLYVMVNVCLRMSQTQYYLKPDKRAWEEMPGWQRPMYVTLLEV